MTKQHAVVIAKDIRRALKLNILNRYDNSEYWDPDIMEEGVHGLSDKDKAKVVKQFDGRNK